MKIEDIKINPKLLKPFMETLDRVKEERRMEYMKIILNDFERTVDKAYQYAISNNEEFETAFSKVMAIRQPGPGFCKDGC